MMALKKTVFLGIDQTGAVNSKGVPHPLPACAIRGNSIAFFDLKELSKAEINRAINAKENETLLVCLDCVLGLPEPIDLQWRQALTLIKQEKVYGRASAMTFFRKIGKGLTPRRRIEVACQANSVFKERPFQRNIQTGTFRLWKDISKHEMDFYVPALENALDKNQIPLFEGYPSLSWKKLFHSESRRPEFLTEFMKEHFNKLKWTASHQSQVLKDPNLADALTLALTVKQYKRQALVQQPDKEGWILGYQENLDTNKDQP